MDFIESLNVVERPKVADFRVGLLGNLVDIEPRSSAVMRVHGALDILHQLRLPTEQRTTKQVIDPLVAMLVLIDVSPPDIDG